MALNYTMIIMSSTKTNDIEVFCLHIKLIYYSIYTKNNFFYNNNFQLQSIYCNISTYYEIWITYNR